MSVRLGATWGDRFEFTCHITQSFFQILVDHVGEPFEAVEIVDPDTMFPLVNGRETKAHVGQIHTEGSHTIGNGNRPPGW